MYSLDDQLSVGEIKIEMRFLETQLDQEPIELT